MTKLYKKSEITFAILWIVAYVVLSSLADQLSESAGIVKSGRTASVRSTASATPWSRQSVFCIICRS